MIKEWKMTEKKLNTLFKKFDDFQYLLESVLHRESLKSWNGSETLKLRMIHNYSIEIEKRLKTLIPEKK